MHSASTACAESMRCNLGICREECSADPSTDRIYELTMQGYNELAKPFMDVPTHSLGGSPDLR